jgi:SSS family transporter
VIERILVAVYLVVCILIGILLSRRVLSSRDEYWVAGRRIGPWVNAMAIMAALASGGSIVGVMGYAYEYGIPATLALFAGAVVGFPLASILVAQPLRRFGKFTITDFLSWRYPHPIIRIGVPILIVVSFTMYIVAQMKAAGITAEELLGISYNTSLTLATLVFVIYVSVGGMLAITWTDVIQGTLMVAVVLGTALLLMSRNGNPVEIFEAGIQAAPALGAAGERSFATDLGAFVIWAAAIPVIPHVVMRVYTARQAGEARLSLNLAMVVYVVVILAAVMIIVPVGKALFPSLEDGDLIFLKIIESQFNPVIRGLAVAAVLAAVMSTTDALLLACSSAVAHDLVANVWGKNLSDRAISRINILVVWIVGLIAMTLAYSPPALITGYYTDAIGALSAGLFVPVIGGLWWKRANLAGGVAAFVVGVAVYAAMIFLPEVPKRAGILIALPASAAAMWLAGMLAKAESPTKIEAVEQLHRDIW